MTRRAYDRLPLPRFEVRAAHPAQRSVDHTRHVATETQARRVAATANRRGYEVTVTLEAEGTWTGGGPNQGEACLTRRQVLYLAPPVIRPPWHQGGAR